MPIIGFEAHWANAIRHIDVVFGEDFTLEPYTGTGANGRPDANARPAPDPSRPVSTFRATYRDKGSKQNAEGRSMPDNTTRSFTADAPHLQVTIPGDGFARPRISDRILRAKTGERFRVSSVSELPHGRIQIALSRGVP